MPLDAILGSGQYRTIQMAFQYYPKEGAIIGRLLAGYSELEIDLTLCLAAALDYDVGMSRSMLN